MCPKCSLINTLSNTNKCNLRNVELLITKLKIIIMFRFSFSIDTYLKIYYIWISRNDVIAMKKEFDSENYQIVSSVNFMIS